MVTMVLLKVAWICTTPEWMTRFSFFLKLFFLPALAGAFAAFAGFAAFAIMSYPWLSSCWQPCRGADPCAYGRWYASAGLAPAARGGAADRDRSPSRCDA